MSRDEETSQEDQPSEQGRKERAAFLIAEAIRRALESTEVPPLSESSRHPAPGSPLPPAQPPADEEPRPPPPRAVALSAPNTRLIDAPVVLLEPKTGAEEREPRAPAPLLSLVPPPNPAPKPGGRLTRTRDSRPSLVMGVSTWNRQTNLSQFIETFDATRSKDYSWTLIVADDGSTDGTHEFLAGLALEDCQVIVVENKCSAITGQTNSILLAAKALGFDFGFKCDDDVFFLKAGWDKLYYDAAKASGKDHLVYHNVSWKPGKHDKRSSQLRSLVPAREAMGCLYTFTPRVLREVGFFDELEFVFRGHAHLDFTVRCCRAGFNDEKTLWDAAGSQELVGMVSREDYVHLVDWNSPEVKSILTPEERARRMKVIDRRDRVFVPARRLDPAAPRSSVHARPSDEAAYASLLPVTRFRTTRNSPAGFDMVYVLNMDHDVLKWAVTAEGLARHGLQAQRFPGVNGNLEQHATRWREYAATGLTIGRERKLGRKLIQSPGAWGYLLTMEKLLQEAKDRRLRNVLVFDDDVLLHRNFQDLLRAAWSELPSWKLLYLGCSQLDWSAAVDYSTYLYHPRAATNGSFAFALSSEVFDLALEETRSFEEPFDAGALRKIDSMHPNQTFAIKPAVVIADVTSSSIRPPRNMMHFAEDVGWCLDEYESRVFARQAVAPHERRRLSATSLVSILLVCEDAEQHVADAVASLRLQTHGKFELLALDNCSTDRTLQVLRSLRANDSRMRVFRTPRRLSTVECWNALLQFAGGEYVCFHDAFEISLPDRLARCIDTQRASGAIWLTADVVPVDALPAGTLDDQSLLLRIAETRRAGGDVGGAAYGLIQRTVYEAVGELLLPGDAGCSEWVARAEIVLRSLRDTAASLSAEVPGVVSVRLAGDRPATASFESYHREIAEGLRPAYVGRQQAAAEILVEI